MTHSAKPPTFEPAAARDAYARIRAEIEAMQRTTDVDVDVDVTAVVAAILCALPKMDALRPRIAMHLGTFDLERFEKMEAYVLALAHTHAEYMSAMTERDAATVDVTAADRELQRTAEERQKAFTLFNEAYEDARRAALFLAPHTADSWVPNLFPERDFANKRGSD